MGKRAMSRKKHPTAPIKPIKPIKPVMAWEQPLDWVPKCPCRSCDGNGMGETTFRGDALIDWDNCDRCSGTGEEPKDDEQAAYKEAP